MTGDPTSSPRLSTWLGALLGFQTGLALLLYFLSSLLNNRASGGNACLGHLVGAQTVGSLLEMKYPGQGRGLRRWLASWNLVIQLALGLLYFLIFGLPESAVTPDPKKTALVLVFVLPIASVLSFGITWGGMSLGIRMMEKHRDRSKK